MALTGGPIKGGDTGYAPILSTRTAVYLNFSSPFQGDNTYENGDPYVVNGPPRRTAGPNDGISYQGDVTLLPHPLNAADQSIVHDGIFAASGQTDINIEVTDMLPGVYYMRAYVAQYNNPPEPSRDYNVNFQEGADVVYVDLSSTNAVKSVAATVSVPDIGNGVGTAKVYIQAINDLATISVLIIEQVSLVAPANVVYESLSDTWLRITLDDPSMAVDHMLFNFQGSGTQYQLDYTVFSSVGGGRIYADYNIPSPDSPFIYGTTYDMEARWVDGIGNQSAVNITPFSHNILRISGETGQLIISGQDAIVVLGTDLIVQCNEGTLTTAGVFADVDLNDPLVELVVNCTTGTLTTAGVDAAFVQEPELIIQCGLGTLTTQGEDVPDPGVIDQVIDCKIGVLGIEGIDLFDGSGSILASVINETVKAANVAKQNVGKF